MSDFGKIKTIIVNMMKSTFQLDNDYIVKYLKAPMVSTKDKSRTSTVSDRLSRMFIDYRNDQLLQWHKCIKFPTMKSVRGALSSYFFQTSSQRLTLMAGVFRWVMMEQDRI